MAALEIKKLCLVSDPNCISKYSLSQKNGCKSGHSQNQNDKALLVKVVRGSSDYSKQNYPVIEYKHSEHLDIANTISTKLMSILSRPVHTVLNNSHDEDIVITLYSEQTLTDRQRNMARLGSDKPKLEELVSTLSQLSTHTKEDQEDKEDKADQEDNAPSAPPAPPTPPKPTSDTEDNAPSELTAPPAPPLLPDPPELFAPSAVNKRR